MARLDKHSRFYRNCLRRRRGGAKICTDCPFRVLIEECEELPSIVVEIGDARGARKATVRKQHEQPRGDRPKSAQAIE